MSGDAMDVLDGGSTDDELLLLEAAALDSLEAQAKRAAGMARERARASQRMEMYEQQSHQDAEYAGSDEMPTSAGGVHRRAAWECDERRRGSAEEKTPPKEKRRGRRKRDPYEKIPFFVAEIMCVKGLKLDYMCDAMQ
jgi:hypothetical protein